MEVCHNCAKEPRLIALIESEGSSSVCHICQEKNDKTFSIEHTSFRNLFRALIRYYYNEWDYNSHWGGDGLESLLYQENNILNYKEEYADRYEEVLLDLLEPPYMDYNKGISFYAGYSEDGTQNMLLRALKDPFDYPFRDLQKKLEKKNYFLLEEDAFSLLDPHLANVSEELLAETILHRARQGYKNRATPLDSFGTEFYFEPYKGQEISAPPPGLSGNGRMNREGVSFLYLATEIETAICEIRPHPGHYVSIGSFMNDRKLNIANFHDIPIEKYVSSDEELDKYTFLKSIDSAFGLPIVPEERKKYSFTQFLSEVIRKRGFDGIRYSSSVGTGTNYVFFDPSNFSYIDGSGKTVLTQTLKYTFQELQELQKDGEYMTDPEGKYL